MGVIGRRKVNLKAIGHVWVAIEGWKVSKANGTDYDITLSKPSIEDPKNISVSSNRLCDDRQTLLLEAIQTSNTERGGTIRIVDMVDGYDKPISAKTTALCLKVLNNANDVV